VNSGQTGIGILDNEVEFFGGSKPTSHEIEDLGSAVSSTSVSMAELQPPGDFLTHVELCECFEIISVSAIIMVSASC